MSIPGLLIRTAGVADLAEVVRLERAAAEAPHWAEVEYAAIVAGSLELVRRCLLVAQRDSETVGFAVGKVIGSGGPAELESVAVDANARRLGVGRELCLAVIEWCRQQGAAELELEVRAVSEGAIALYRGLGFAEVGRRREYYREPLEDAVLMRLGIDRGK